MAGGVLPDWMMLERFVLRRDDPESFPAEEAAPFTASSTTSLGDPFRLAFLVAAPPAISRLYVQWPRGGLDPAIGVSCDLVTAHRNLVLFRLTCNPVTVEGSPFLRYNQDHFVCRASSSPAPHQPPLMLKRIPLCTKPIVLRVKKGKEITTPRFFHIHTLGLLCRGEGEEEEFAMAQLVVVKRIESNAEGELCVLRSRLSDDDHDVKWEIKQKISIQYREDEYLDLLYWNTDTVIPFNDHLCWVDYHRGGMLFCDVFAHTPIISYLRLPIADRPTNTSQSSFREKERSVCVTEGGASLKFVDVVRDDGELAGPMQPDTGFTITFHTLNITDGVMKWDKDLVIRSDELWARNSPERLPRDVLMFPLVSMDRPQVVHFLVFEYGDESDKVWRVSVDTDSKAVLSISLYIDTEEDLCGKDDDMICAKSHLQRSFLPSEFHKFFHPTRKMMNMGYESCEKGFPSIGRQRKDFAMLVNNSEVAV